LYTAWILKKLVTTTKETQISGILTRTPKFWEPYDGDTTIRYDKGKGKGTWIYIAPYMTIISSSRCSDMYHTI